MDRLEYTRRMLANGGENEFLVKDFYIEISYLLPCDNTVILDIPNSFECLLNHYDHNNIIESMYLQFVSIKDTGKSKIYRWNCNELILVILDRHVYVISIADETNVIEGNWSFFVGYLIEPVISNSHAELQPSKETIFINGRFKVKIINKPMCALGVSTTMEVHLVSLVEDI